MDFGEKAIVTLGAGYLIFGVVWFCYYSPRNSIIERRKRDKEKASTWRKQLKSVVYCFLTAIILSGLFSFSDKTEQYEAFIILFIFLFLPMIFGIIKGYSMLQSDVEALNERHLWFKN
jgi:hypothetical protein